MDGPSALCAGHPVAVKGLPGAGNDAKLSAGGAEDDAYCRVGGGVGERQPIIAADRIVALAPGSADDLRGAVDGLESLDVVVMAVDHQRGMAGNRSPKRLDVVL